MRDLLKKMQVMELEQEESMVKNLAQLKRALVKGQSLKLSPMSGRDV